MTGLPTVTPRHFVLGLGVVAVLVGLWGLMGTVTVAEDRVSPIPCGTALSPDTSTAVAEGWASSRLLVEAGGSLQDATYQDDFPAWCRDAIGSRQAWSWPVTAVGVVAVVGAVFVRPQGSSHGQSPKSG